MKKIIKSTLLFLAVTAGMGTFVSCSDDDDSGMNGLFRPVIAEDNITHGLNDESGVPIPYMIINWDNYATANKYVVTIAANDGSDERSIETAETTCRFDGLQYDKEYNISIHSENTTNGLSSKDYTMTTTSLDYPTELATIQSTDITDREARIKWAGNGEIKYDSIAIVDDSEDTLVTNVVLKPDKLTGVYSDETQDIIKSGEVIIYNLTPKTSYRAEAYYNDEYRGKKRFSTVASENYEGIVIDLRGEESGRDEKNENSLTWFSVGSGSAYANAIDSLLNIPEYANQDITFVLQGGEKYRLPTMTIPATTGTLRFVTGLTLAGNAEFYVTGNFTVAKGAHVGGFVFDKINFSGANPLNDNNYGGKYLFNMGNAGASIDSISITNCNIKWKRGVIRIQTEATIEKITIDNCIIDSIAGYGVVNADNEKAAMNNINVTNSTFSVCQVMFTNNKGISPNSVNVSNCTFWRCSTDKKYIMDFKGKTIKSFTFNNNLMGPALGETGLEFYSGDVKPDYSDNYFTSDLVWRVKSEEDPTPKAQISGTTLSTDVAGTFKDAENDDFTVISKELGTGKPTPGDPRWYE